ncbi:MAG TPA: hypothetical protein VE093_48230 [Polyangiaceae bacterium]|nr:hypothetical protein [Polyangiaceae bacterium]
MRNRDLETADVILLLVNERMFASLEHGKRALSGGKNTSRV